MSKDCNAFRISGGHCGNCQTREDQRKGIFRTPEAEAKIQALKAERKKTGRSIFAGIFIDPEVHREITESARARTAEGGM